MPFVAILTERGDVAHTFSLSPESSPLGAIKCFQPKPVQAHVSPNGISREGDGRDGEGGDEAGVVVDLSAVDAGRGLHCPSVCLTPNKERSGDGDWTGVGLLPLTEGLGSCSEERRALRRPHQGFRPLLVSPVE